MYQSQIYVYIFNHTQHFACNYVLFGELFGPRMWAIIRTLHTKKQKYRETSCTVRLPNGKLRL